MGAESAVLDWAVLIYNKRNMWYCEQCGCSPTKPMTLELSYDMEENQLSCMGHHLVNFICTITHFMSLQSEIVSAIKCCHLWNFSQVQITLLLRENNKFYSWKEEREERQWGILKKVKTTSMQLFSLFIYLAMLPSQNTKLCCTKRWLYTRTLSQFLARAKNHKILFALILELTHFSST